jgi:hypothetical protein
MGKLRKDNTPSQRLNLDLVRRVSSSGNEAPNMVEQSPPPVEPAPTPAPKERLTRTRRVLFTPSESKHLDQVIAQLAEEVGLDTLNWSQITRALWRLLEGDFDPTIPVEGINLKAPPSTDLEAVQQFDRELASYLYQRVVLHRG